MVDAENGDDCEDDLYIGDDGADILVGWMVADLGNIAKPHVVVGMISS